MLYEILRRSSEPLNSGQIWLQAEVGWVCSVLCSLFDLCKYDCDFGSGDQCLFVLQEAGMKSKRHVKQLLNAMRKASVLQTKPMGKGKNYTYDLRNTTAKVVANEIGKAPQ